MSAREAARPSVEPLCPLCGGANECAPARSGSFDTPCWCTGVAFAPEALANLPAEARGRACLCRRCATMPVPARPESETSQETP